MRTRKINSGIYCTVLLTFHMIAGLQIRKNVIFLRLHRIALWDVLEKGERKGSSDKDIREPVMNDFEELFTKYPLLRKVIINSKGLKKGRNKEMREIAKKTQICI